MVIKNTVRGKAFISNDWIQKRAGALNLNNKSFRIIKKNETYFFKR